MNNSQVEQIAEIDGRRRQGRRVLVTGQVGLDKKVFLEQVADLARSRGHCVEVVHVGDRMYAEAPDVAPGKILDLPKRRLEQLRRSVFKDVIASTAPEVNLIVNTHATFRWRHGLFHAYDYADMQRLNADMFVTLIDNADSIHERLTREHRVRHTLKDVLVWREEETVVTRALAESLKGYGHDFIAARTESSTTVESLYRLIFEPHRKRVYPSFPMTHVTSMPNLLAEIDRFRARLSELFITFDPGDVDEKNLLLEAEAAAARGERTMQRHLNGRDIELSSDEIISVGSDIDAQIYARDFMLVDQSDMIVSYIPELPGGKPGLSSGVERELQHAFEATKEVYIIWRPTKAPSPFVTETATKVFRTVDELFAYLKAEGQIPGYQPDLFDCNSSAEEATAAESMAQ